MAGTRGKDVDAYVRGLPKEQKPIVEDLRDFVFANAPHLAEKPDVRRQRMTSGSS